MTAARGFGLEVGTLEFNVFDYTPTGKIEVCDVIGNGVVAGLACAYLWGDSEGNYKTQRS